MVLSRPEPAPPGPLSDPQDLYGLIRIRWMLAGLVVLGAIGTRLAGTITVEGFYQGLGIIAGVCLYNLIYIGVLRAAGTRPDRARWRNVIRWLQQPSDILSLTLLLHLIPTGGVTPLAILYGVSVLSAIVILPPRGIYAVTAFAILCYGALVIYEFYFRPLPPPYTLLYNLRGNGDAARVPPNAIVMMVIALVAIALIAGRFARRLRDNAAQIRRQVADLTALHEELRERALRDSLTGVLNHGALLDRLHTEVDAARARGHAVSLIMLDVDYFKDFNDRWGHQAGDAALQALAAAVEAAVRPGDTLGRWGGEEFGLVLPGVPPDEARVVAERIRDHLASVVLRGPGGETWPTPTMSQGLAGFPQHADSPPVLVACADLALYQAKARGRNSIVSTVADPPAAPPVPAAPQPQRDREAAAVAD